MYKQRLFPRNVYPKTIELGEIYFKRIKRLLNGRFLVEEIDVTGTLNSGFHCGVPGVVIHWMSGGNIAAHLAPKGLSLNH